MTVSISHKNDGMTCSDVARKLGLVFNTCELSNSREGGRRTSTLQSKALPCVGDHCPILENSQQGFWDLPDAPDLDTSVDELWISKLHVLEVPVWQATFQNT